LKQAQRSVHYGAHSVRQRTGQTKLAFDGETTSKYLLLSQIDKDGTTIQNKELKKRKLDA